MTNGEKAHHWRFIKTTLVDEFEVGPITEAEFISEIKASSVKMKTQVSSPTRTKGGWVEAGQLPAIAKMIEKVIAAKAAKKKAAADEKRQNKEAAKEEGVAADP